MSRETEYRGKRLTVRESAKQRKPLDGTDAQALEGALQQVERELSEALKAARAFERLTICYRTGRTPSEALLGECLAAHDHRVTDREDS